MAVAVVASAPVSAQTENESRPGFIPQRAIIIHGDAAQADSSVIAVFYSRENLDFSDADAPRFLLLDRKGKVAFGVGGSLYAVGSYDFDGAVDDAGFTTYEIAVPNDPSVRQRFGADVSHSSLFAKLVGRSDRFGIYTVYIQAAFNGGDGGYGFKLKHAYASIGHLTAGLTTSTFIDGDVQAPTIDPQCAGGQVTDRSMLFRYTTPSYKGLRGAISVEVPKVSYSFADGADGQATAKKIAQRVPNIPAYVQYGWDDESHVRLSAIFVDMAYRNLVEQKNVLSAGWGVKLSAIARLGMFRPFGHVSYGKGISQFINDISGQGLDMVPDTEAGKLKPVPSMTWTAGTYVNFTPKCFATASVSRSQIFDTSVLGPDSYRYGMYIAANAFYNFDSNFRVGAEYLHGIRNNRDGESGHANRVEVLLQYSF